MHKGNVFLQDDCFDCFGYLYAVQLAIWKHLDGKLFQIQCTHYKDQMVFLLEGRQRVGNSCVDDSKWLKLTQLCITLPPNKIMPFYIPMQDTSIKKNKNK